MYVRIRTRVFAVSLIGKSARGGEFTCLVGIAGFVLPKDRVRWSNGSTDNRDLVFILSLCVFLEKDLHPSRKATII